MFSYEIGGNERKIDVSEGFVEISHNKTLFVEKLTDQDPIKPEAVAGLKTVKDVFAHFKPNCDVEFEKEDGSIVNENLRFSNVGDFNAKNVIHQSKYLRDVNLEKDMYFNIIRQLKSNKALKRILDNKDTKEAFINVLKSLAEELDDNQ